MSCGLRSKSTQLIPGVLFVVKKSENIFTPGMSGIMKPAA
jgi:hypothetical protein